MYDYVVLTLKRTTGMNFNVISLKNSRLISAQSVQAPKLL